MNSSESKNTFCIEYSNFVQTTNKLIHKSYVGVTTSIQTLAIQIRKHLYNIIVAEIIDWPWKQSMNHDDNNEGKFNNDPPTEK